MELTQNNEIALPTRRGFIMKDAKDIVRCEAEGIYTCIFFKDGEMLVVSKNLGACEKKLSPFNFFRVHVSHLINKSFIHEYIAGNTGQLIMKDNSRIPVSRRCKRAFLDWLKTTTYKLGTTTY